MLFDFAAKITQVFVTNPPSGVAQFLPECQSRLSSNKVAQFGQVYSRITNIIIKGPMILGLRQVLDQP